MLYGLLKGWEPEKCLQFGWATGAIATTFLTDYGAPADEDQIWSDLEGQRAHQALSLLAIRAPVRASGRGSVFQYAYRSPHRGRVPGR